ncbi:MAG: hypothetical protein ACFFBD_01890 [Candidatus Hodarchaeota archaeon]
MSTSKKKRKLAGLMKFQDETIPERFVHCGYKGLNEYNNIKERLRRITSPQLVQLIIDAGCNQNCVHCCLGQTRTKTPTVSSKIRAVGNALVHQGFKIDPYPTEPLMSTASLESYSWFRNPKERPFLTAGTAPLARLPGSQLADLLNSFGFSEVWVSLHGSNSQSHDAFTGTLGSFDIAMETIQKVGKIAGTSGNLKLVFDVCVHKENISELADILAIAAQNNAHRAYIMRLYEPCRSAIPRKMIMDYQASWDALVEINRLRLVHKGRIWIQMGQSWGTNFHGSGIYHYLATTNLSFCFAIAPRITIHPGRKKIYPCFLTMACPEFEIGFLEEDNYQIHFNTLGEQLLGWHKDWEGKAHGTCAVGDCPYSEICHGACRGTAVTPSIIAGNTPDWFAPFPDCITVLLTEMS